MQYAHYKVSKENYARARRLRREMTFPEKLIWHKLRQIPKEWEITFRRQQPIHIYVVDFISLKHKLIVELDGDSHATTEHKDAARDAYLNKRGYTVIRFSNVDAVNNPDGVIATILSKIRTNG